MTSPTDLGKNLDELASKMLEDAQKDGVKLTDRLEVFKIVSTHFVNLKKVNKKGEPDDDDGTPTMDSLRNRVKGEPDE